MKVCFIADATDAQTMLFRLQVKTTHSFLSVVVSVLLLFLLTMNFT